MNLTLKGSELRDIIYGDNEDWEEVKDTKTIDEQDRWHTYFSAIFTYKPLQEHYLISWSCGSTEMQDEGPFEYELDKEFSITQMVQMEVTKLEWVIA